MKKKMFLKPSKCYIMIQGDTMTLTQTTVFYIAINILFIIIISFSFAVILRKHTSFDFLFNLPLGLLCFFGITYLLAFPFVFLRISASLYQLLLFLIFISVFIYALFIVFKEKHFFTAKKLQFTLLGIATLFVLFTLYIASNQTLGEQAFDSVFYMTFVGNNVTTSYLGWRNYDSNVLSTSFNLKYDFSSYYYFNSFVIKMTKTIFPSMNEITYGSQFVWQGSFMLMFLNTLTFFNLSKQLIKEKKYSILIVLFSILCLFFGSRYYNTALAFIGNNFRVIIIANILMLLHQMYQTDDFSNKNLLVTSLLFAALISITSSGFFIAAFMLYGTFFVLLNKYRLVAFKVIALLGYPVFLYLFTFLFQYWTVVLTPLTVVLFLFLSKIQSQDINSNFEKYMSIIMKYIIPAIIITIVFLLDNQFQYKMDYFFLKGSTQDMVWDYFSFETLPFSLVNICLLFLLATILFKKSTDSFLRNFLAIILITFLNPLVIPFTIKFLTEYVFYRAFDIIFNPFTISFGIISLYESFPKIRKLFVLFALPFIWVSYSGFTTHYHNCFQLPAYYNRILKSTTDEISVHLALNEIIATSNFETYPIVASQSFQTSGLVPHISLAYYNQTMRSNSIKYLTHDQAELYNVFALYNRPEPDWTAASIVRITEILDLNNATFAIVLKSSSYHDEENDITYYLVEEVGEYYILIFENDTYALFRNPTK